MATSVFLRRFPLRFETVTLHVNRAALDLRLYETRWRSSSGASAVRLDDVVPPS